MNLMCWNFLIISGYLITRVVYDFESAHKVYWHEKSSTSIGHHVTLSTFPTYHILMSRGRRKILVNEKQLPMYYSWRESEHLCPGDSRPKIKNRISNVLFSSKRSNKSIKDTRTRIWTLILCSVNTEHCNGSKNNVLSVINMHKHTKRMYQKYQFLIDFSHNLFRHYRDENERAFNPVTGVSRGRKTGYNCGTH